MALSERSDMKIFSYLDHPIRLVPEPYAWPSHPVRPSLTPLLLGCHHPLLQEGKRLCPIKAHKT